MNIKNFSTYADSIEANMALNKLQANGIPCFLDGEHSNDTMWHISVGLGGVKLMVHEADVARAESILKEGDLMVSPPKTSEGVAVCPRCGSGNVHYGVLTRSRIGWFGIVLSFLIAAPAPVPNKGYHCFNCQHEFH